MGAWDAVAGAAVFAGTGVAGVVAVLELQAHSVSTKLAASTPHNRSFFMFSFLFHIQTIRTAAKQRREKYNG